MEKLKLFTTILCFVLSVATLNGQTMKVTSSTIQMKLPALINSLGATDGLDVTTSGSSAILPSGSDLIWGAFYQAQPNNPGIFSLTSVSSPMGWNPCFTVRANGSVGIMNSSPTAGVALEIGTASSTRMVKVNGAIVWGSDVRMKENVQDLSGSLGQLTKLRGVSYRLKEEAQEESIPEKILKDGSLNLEKTRTLVKGTSKSDNPLASRTVYGFLAQDVQELFPDLVYEDESTGMLSVDYIGLIPLLSDALKGQQAQLEEQRTQIASILKLVTGEKTIDAFAKDAESLAILHQNTPNPFSQSTVIGFYIPKEVQAANLYVYDRKGLQKKSFLISEREEGSVTLDAATLDAGVYFYTLVCDGKPVDSKQLILTK